MATEKKQQSLSRSQILVRAAKLRAKMISLIKKTPGISTPDLVAQMQDTLKAEQANDTSVITQLLHLQKSELIATIKDGNKASHYLPDAKPAKVRKEKAVKAQPDFTVDLVKATGRVRVSIGGFVIEIGVA